MIRYLRHLPPVFVAGTIALALAACDKAPDTGANGHLEFSDEELIGRTFQIQDVAGHGVIDSSHITLTFGRDGQFSGSMGCNTAFGPYQRSGTELAFGALGATKKMCPPALMNQEQAVLDILAAVTRIEQDKEGALIVSTADGRSLRGFESAQLTQQLYLCDDGSTVKVAYPTRDTVQIVYNGETVDMTIAPSASGARYTGGGWEWWSKGAAEAYLAPLATDEMIASGDGIACVNEQPVNEQPIEKIVR